MSTLLIIILIILLLGVGGRGYLGYGTPITTGYPSDPMSIIAFILVIALIIWLIRGHL